MNYLTQAEHYCLKHGDQAEFQNLYQGFRQYNGVGDSVWMTLIYLYGIDVARELRG